MTTATTQPTLWDPPAAPRKRRKRATSDTSTDGLLSVQPRADTQRARVLETLRAWGPMTRHDLADACGLPLSSICGRVGQLMRQGLIREQVVAGRRIRKDGRHVVMAAFQTLNRRAG